MNYKDIFSCAGKNVVVFGGAGLIGKEIVLALSEFGANVFAVDLSFPSSLKSLVTGKVSFLEGDITVEANLRRIVDTVIGECGRVHAMINCAYPRTADWATRFESIPYASWKQNVDAQLGSCFLACQILAEHMKGRGGGSIVNFGSTYGVVSPDFTVYEGTDMTSPAAYTAIKGGIVNFTRYLASYYGRYHVRVNCLSPGGIFDNQPAAFVGNYEKKVPLGRMGTPSDIAPAAVFLASDASRYVTGHNLMVDGGWTAV